MGQIDIGLAKKMLVLEYVDLLELNVFINDFYVFYVEAIYCENVFNCNLFNVDEFFEYCNNWLLNNDKKGINFGRKIIYSSFVKRYGNLMKKLISISLFEEIFYKVFFPLNDSYITFVEYITASVENRDKMLNIINSYSDKKNVYLSLKDLGIRNNLGHKKILSKDKKI